MSTTYLMGMDQGGSGVRCLLLDTGSGHIHHAARRCAARRTPGTGGLGADLDLDLIWASLCAAAGEVMQSAGAKPDQIAGIAAASMRLGSVVLDSDGEAILAVPNVDARAAGEGLRMAAEHGAALLPRTGHWPLPIMAAPRLQWLAAQRADAWKRAAHYFSISDWLTWRLSGEALADPSQASVTLLFGITKSSWDWDWIDELGFPRHLFPEVRESGTPAGSLSREAARDLGLRAGTPVAVGGADTQCALLGLGAVAPGQVAAIAGSTAPLQAVVGRPVIPPDGRLWTARHVVPERWVVESNAGPMGDAVEWAARLFYPDAQQPVAKLFGEAATAPVGAAGQLSTLGTQIMNARAMGMPTGDLTLAHMSCRDDPQPRRHLVRAISEGLACGLRANLEQLQGAVGDTFPELMLGGGLAESASFVATLADMLDAPVARCERSQVTARGAALCAGVGALVWRNFSEAAHAAASPLVSHTPDSQKAAQSQSVYASWHQLRTARADTEQLAGQLATPWVMAANDRAAVDVAAGPRLDILVCADFDPASLDALRELGNVEYASFRDNMRLLKGPSLVEAAAGFGILISEIDLVDGESLARMPDMRIIAVCRGDAVNIDVDACTAYGIPVLNTPGRNAGAVADLTLAFLLMLARKFPAASAFLRQPGIEAGDMGKMGQAFVTLQGRELWHKTVGLVGFGAVGRQVARRLAGFSARVLVNDPFVSPEEAAAADATWVSLEELLAVSDFISLHAAVTDATRELIDAEALSRIKPGACLINTARAALTDEGALADALASGQLGGLALDTFSLEPPGSGHPLLAFDNVIATPHLGGNTREIAAHQGQMVASELAGLLAGERSSEQPGAVLNAEVLERFDLTAPRRQPSAGELERLSTRDAPAVTDLQRAKDSARRR